jgi:hypothetical protein
MSDSTETTVLSCPIGAVEPRLVVESGWRAFARWLTAPDEPLPALAVS